MPKYRIFENFTASRFVGEFEGNNEDDAIEKAYEQDEGFGGLCHHCANELDLSDGDFFAEEI